MRIFLIGFFAMTIGFGCSTTNSNESLKDIFVLVQNKRFDEAKGKLRGDYSTYSGERLSSVKEPHSIKDNVDDLIDLAQSKMERCESISEEAKKISANNPGDEGEFLFKEKIAEDHQVFERECIQDLSNRESVVSKVKRYSSVDLEPIFLKYAEVFRVESKRIGSEFDQIKSQSEKATLDASERKLKYEQSEEYYSLKLCEMAGLIKLANKAISRENEAGKLSGFVDKNKMYEAGRMIQVNKENIGRFSKEYKSKFGKSWRQSACK